MSYTHKITYYKYIARFGYSIPHIFRTTPDMVDRHVSCLKRSKLVSIITVQELL